VSPAFEPSQNQTNEANLVESAISIENKEPVEVAANSGVVSGLDNGQEHLGVSRGKRSAEDGAGAQARRKAEGGRCAGRGADQGYSAARIPGRSFRRVHHDSGLACSLFSVLRPSDHPPHRDGICEKAKTLPSQRKCQSCKKLLPECARTERVAIGRNSNPCKAVTPGWVFRHQRACAPYVLDVSVRIAQPLRHERPRLTHPSSILLLNPPLWHRRTSLDGRRTLIPK